MSGMAPGCVKTSNLNLRVEISSRFLRFENQKCWQPLSGEDNSENNSAHSWLVHVFTQPRSKADKPSRPKNHLCPLLLRKRPNYCGAANDAKCHRRTCT